MSDKFIKSMIAKNRAFAGAKPRESALVYNKSLEMFTIDRPTITCAHRTAACVSCYTKNAYDIYPNMESGDFHNEIAWQRLDPIAVKNELSRKRRGTSVVRLMSRGEAFSEIEDIERVRGLVAGNPETSFWIPTRAWRCNKFRALIEEEIMSLPNAFVSASIDFTSTKEDVAALKARGWRFMYFSNDNVAEVEMELGIKMTLCPKTHFNPEHAHGVCNTCRMCFSGERKAIHLKNHYRRRNSEKIKRATDCAMARPKKSVVNV